MTNNTSNKSKIRRLEMKLCRLLMSFIYRQVISNIQPSWARTNNKIPLSLPQVTIPSSTIRLVVEEASISDPLLVTTLTPTRLITREKWETVLQRIPSSRPYCLRRETSKIKMIIMTLMHTSIRLANRLLEALTSLITTRTLGMMRSNQLIFRCFSKKYNESEHLMHTHWFIINNIINKLNNTLLKLCHHKLRLEERIRTRTSLNKSRSSPTTVSTSSTNVPSPTRMVSRDLCIPLRLSFFFWI